MAKRKVVWLPEPLDRECHDCGVAVPVRRVWRPLGLALVGSDLCADCVARADDEVTLLVEVAKDGAA